MFQVMLVMLEAHGLHNLVLSCLGSLCNLLLNHTQINLRRDCAEDNRACQKSISTHLNDRDIVAFF